MGRDIKKSFPSIPICMKAMQPTSLGPHFLLTLKFSKCTWYLYEKSPKSGNLNLYTLEEDISFTNICDHSSVKIRKYFRMMYLILEVRHERREEPKILWRNSWKLWPLHSKNVHGQIYLWFCIPSWQRQWSINESQVKTLHCSSWTFSGCQFTQIKLLVFYIIFCKILSYLKFHPSITTF